MAYSPGEQQQLPGPNSSTNSHCKSPPRPPLVHVTLLLPHPRLISTVAPRQCLVCPGAPWQRETAAAAFYLTLTTKNRPDPSALDSRGSRRRHCHRHSSLVGRTAKCPNRELSMGTLMRVLQDTSQPRSPVRTSPVVYTTTSSLCHNTQVTLQRHLLPGWKQYRWA